MLVSQAIEFEALASLCLSGSLQAMRSLCSLEAGCIEDP